MLLLLAFTSADIDFYKFLELYSTLSEKKIFLTNFPFLTDSLKHPTTPPPAPYPHLNDPNLLSLTKVFCRCSLSTFWVLQSVNTIKL